MQVVHNVENIDWSVTINIIIVVDYTSVGTMTCNAHNSVNNGSIWTIFGEYTLWMMMLYQEKKTQLRST